MSSFPGPRLCALAVLAMGVVLLPVQAVAGAGDPARQPTPTSAQSAVRTAALTPQWSKGQRDHDESVIPSTISCPTTAFCMAIDAFGHVVSYDGVSWTAPARVIPESMVTPAFPQSARVACPSAEFCVATLSHQNFLPGLPDHSYAVVWDGATWSSPVRMDDEAITALACPSVSECFAADQAGQVVTFDGAAWSSPVPMTSKGYVVSLSCVDASFCMALGKRPYRGSFSYVYDGSTWTALDGQPGGRLPESVSCASSTFCMAVGQSDFTVYDGESWSAPQLVPGPREDVEAVACGSPASCVVTGLGFWIRYDDGSWSSWQWAFGHELPADMSGLACPGADACIDVFDSGKSFTYDGTVVVRYDPYATELDGDTWTQPTHLGDSEYGVAGIACPRANSCVVVDSGGLAQTRTHGTLNPPFLVDSDPDRGLTDVSCPSILFCATTSATGYVSTFDFAGTASTAPVTPGKKLKRISCASSHWCIAVTDIGDYTVYDGSAWSAVTSAPMAIDDLACVSRSFCMAEGLIGYDGYAAVYDGHDWVDLQALAGSGEQSGLACGSVSLCVVSSTATQMQVFDGTTWGAPVTVSQHEFLESAACGATECAVGYFGYDGGNHYGLTSVYSDGSWSQPLQISDDGEISYLACPPNNACEAQGNQVSYRLKNP
jgi:hypothetical protein